MATQQEFTEEQLTAARMPLWHQQGEPLLTEEAAAEFVGRFGLVLFAPGRLSTAAPTLVEATLGEPRQEASVADAAVARSLAARLMASGEAVPLNLLGGPGEAPDFLASSAVLPFVFTLRGDKNWKKAPATSGAVKVSPLSLRVFEVLTERGAQTAPELAAELGREVTEAAIVRALNELWQMLRVFPQYAAGEGATLWQLATQRFTRALKAGANAGQPTALSAVVSLYLRQSIAATSEEIETFLSPLAARSRVREVLHALTAARELGEVVVAGKNLLHVAGELPEFAALQAAAAEPAEGQAEGEAVEGGESAAPARPRVEFSETEVPEPGRIRRFAAGRAPREDSVGERRPARREGGAFARKPRPQQAGGERAFGRGPRQERSGTGGFSRGPREERGGGGTRPPQRRSFGASKPASAGTGETAGREFTRPWDEERRPARPRTPRAEGGQERRGGPGRFGAGAGERRERPAGAGGRPATSRGGARPFSDRREPRKEWKPRTEGAGAERPFNRRPAREEGSSAERPFNRRPTAREEGTGGERPFRPRPFRPREEGEGRGGEQRPWKGKPGRPAGDRPQGGASRGGAPKKFGGPFVRREGGSAARGEGRSAGAPRPFSRPRGERTEQAGEERRPRFGQGAGAGERKPRPFGGERKSRPQGSGGASRFGGERRGGPAGGGRGGAGRGPGAGRGAFGGNSGKRFGGKPSRPKRKPEE